MPITLKLPPSPPRSAKTVDLYRGLAPLAALGFGFFLQFNVMTSTFGLPIMRLTDGLLFAFLPCLFFMVGIAGTIRNGLVYFVVLFAIVLTSLLFKTQTGPGDIYFTLIYLLTAIFAFYFVLIATENDAVIVSFCIGTVCGLIPSLIVLFMQAGGDTSLANVGLGVRTEDLPDRATLLGTIKLGGMWVHGNEAGHVYAIAAAPALYLAMRFRRPIIYIATYVALVASFAVTLNRAGLIGPTFGLIYCYARLGDYFLYVKSAIAGSAVLCVLLMATNIASLDTFYDSFQSRFVEDNQTNTNLEERLTSNAAGLEIAFENPFGIGTEERITQMVDKTSSHIFSIHNGFLSMSFQSSIFVSLAYIVSCIYLWRRRRDVSPFYIMTFLFTVTSMFFEELSINQAFIFSVALTIAAAWVHFYRGYAQRRLQPSRPTLGLRYRRAVHLRDQETPDSAGGI